MIGTKAAKSASTAPDRPVGEVGEPAGAAASFEVVQPAYQGDLAGLSHALRVGRVAPRELDLLGLVRDVLVWFEREAAADLETASVALPQVARVVELKLRLLLPRPPRDPDDEEVEEYEADGTLQAIALLEELESAIAFLRRRRFERALVVPTRMAKPELPRPHRPLAATAGKLAALASQLRPGGYFELARDRLTLDGAMRTLRRALGALGRGRMDDLHPSRDWAERTVVFAGMLELVREGEARARQDEPYGAIELERTARPPRAPGVATEERRPDPDEARSEAGRGVGGTGA